MAPATNSSSPSAHIPLGSALRFWLKLGCISFGGPAGQIAIMHRELVETRRWISEKRYLHALNYCMVLPGPEAQQLATYLGWLMHGTVGGIAAGALFVLPSLVLLIALSWLYLAFGQVPVVAALFYGVKAAVVALVLHAAWRLGNRTLKRAPLIGIALAAFVALFFFDAPFPAIIAVAALIGWWLRASLGNAASAHGASANAPAGDHPNAVIDDNTPTPPHARWNLARCLRLGAIGVGLWLLAMLVLLVTVGWSHTLTQMGWFFSKAAMVTFGGAYAVLPYVYDAAVEHFHWLTAAQMIDGLALGETTPGPLIMIVAFVAYIGGVGNEVVAGNSFASGALAACVVTFFTFLPSFIFILAGAPFIESTRDDLRLSAPLTAITAAVVGVIAKLALVLAWHVWWPGASMSAPFAVSFEWPAAALTVAASIALMRHQVGVIWVIAACGAAGVAIKLFA